MTKKIVKRTDANNETLYFYTHSDAVDVGEGSSTKSLTEVIDDTLHKSAQTLTNAEKTQALVNLGLNGVDDVPTENSNNIVRSGGVKAAIDDVIDDFTNRGFMYKGIAPASAPLGEDKTFYIAKSGDYTAYTGIGDGSFTLNGIAVLTYATTTASGAWTKNDIVLFDEEPTAGSNNLVKSGGVKNELALGAVYDVSAKNPTAGHNNDGKWESLSALLSDANLNTLIPTAVRKGGMSIKFVQSSDNKYIHYNLIADEFTTDITQWAIAEEGVYVDNPEFVYVKTDKEDKILWAIKTDGSIYYGAGVPQQVIDYIEKKIADLSLDEYEDIVAFLNGLEEGDKTLPTLLNEKVDKEEGKSLIDEEYASTKSTTDNPEFLEVTTDSEDKVLEGIQQDGTKVIGGDIKVLGNMEVSGVSYKVIENPEYLAAWIDAEDRVIFGIKSDGKTYVGDADFINDIENIKAFLANFDDKNIDWDALTSITATENPEYISVVTDSEDKILAGRTPDGVKFENVGVKSKKVSTENLEVAGIDLTDNVDAIDSASYIEDPEGRTEIKTDTEGRIISYRDSDGVIHEEVGIETNGLKLSEDGMSDFQQALKNSGFQSGAGDYSDKTEIQIPEPVLAFMNITNINAMPTTKTTDGHAIVEVYDGRGNYFKKKAIINAQGNSSLSHAKKNFALDWCEDEWEGDETPSIKIGKWVAQDSHHFKAYYYDFFDGIPVVGYQWFDEIVRTRGVRNDRCWKRALLPDDATIGDTNVGMNGEDYNLLIDTGARCFPDGFPVIVHLNGEFYGIFCWQLKKHRDNYHQKKDKAKHVHLDGNICSALLWTANGTIDWFKWAGVRAESAEVLNYDGIELRNPKSMVMRDGSEYDQDYLKTLGSSATIEQVEPLGEDSPEYADIVAAAEAMTDAKKRKKRLDAIAYTIAAKAYIVSLTEVIPNLNAMETGGSGSEEIRAYIQEHFDVDSLIDFQIFSDVSANTDGIKKNWQWNTWDGEKWFCSPYDLDWTFGLRGSYSDQGPLSAHLGAGDKNLPCYWIITYFGNQLNTRYAELRRAKIVDAEHLASNLNEWSLRIGLDNYEKELERWPYRRSDNIYRFRNWCIESVENMDSVYSFNN